MTDIVERLRREAMRFNEMDAAGDQPWVADAAWAADNFSAAADQIERLRAALALGLRMQEAQRAYFKARTRETLAASLEIEREFAQTARALLEEGER